MVQRFAVLPDSEVAGLIPGLSLRSLHGCVYRRSFWVEIFGRWLSSLEKVKSLKVKNPVKIEVWKKNEIGSFMTKARIHVL